jgi:hypothetical protein
MVKVAHHHGEQKKGAPDHNEADEKTDQVLQFADAVGKPVAGCPAQGEDGQVGGEDGQKVGALFEQVAEDREGVRNPSGPGHQQDVHGAKPQSQEEIFFTGAGDGGRGHGEGWKGKVNRG